MLEMLTGLAQVDAGSMLADLLGVLTTIQSYVLIFAGFSLVIFVHELGHFIAAKLCGVRVDKFAVGFGRELFGFTKGETRYSFNILPLGGFVKMLGQEDFAVDKSGELMVKENPRSFTNKSVGKRMVIVSSGVVMNLLFAAAAFALVFMLGMPSIPAEIGLLQAGMPAEQAGLRVGDRILKINSQSIADQTDLQAAVVLSNPDAKLSITYERKDPTGGEAKVETVEISPEMSSENNVLRIGVGPPMTNEVGSVINAPGLKPEEQIQIGDRVVAVNGERTDSFYQIQDRLADLKGDWATLTIARPTGPVDSVVRMRGEADKVPSEQKTIRWRARQSFVSTGGGAEQSGHLLGLVPRQRVRQALEGRRGDLAGVKTGDVIVRWGGQTSPRLDEIIQSRRENANREIRVTVYREGEGEKTVTITPKGPGMMGRGAAVDGLVWGSQECDQLVVADIIPKVTDTISTPAAELKDVMPRGALITKVNDQPVKTWNELSQQFLKLAGTKVKLTWTYQGLNEQSGEIYVPNTIGTTFPLPGARQIISINGVHRKEVVIDGKRATRSADNWLGASEILRGCVGKKVEIVYRANRETEPRSVMVDVTPEWVDTWTMRANYVVDDLITWPRITVLRERNPLKAATIGLHKTVYFIEQVYLTMQRMVFTRTMSVEQISGPVGILQAGSQLAQAGMPQLLYFLALISANLAVINFMPLPIMDGGLFVFLLIEKIKGSPLSMKVQVATQLIGLALIIGIFIFVTFQDIQKLAN